MKNIIPKTPGLTVITMGITPKNPLAPGLRSTTGDVLSVVEVGENFSKKNSKGQKDHSKERGRR